MNWLFIHQNAQYCRVVRRLADAGDRVIGIGRQPSTEVFEPSRIKYTPAPTSSVTQQHIDKFDTAMQMASAWRGFASVLFYISSSATTTEGKRFCQGCAVKSST
jgi:hypothetical protein